MNEEIRDRLNISPTVWPAGRPISVAVRSKAGVCGRSLAGTVGSNPTRGMDICLLLVMCVLCFQVDVSVTGRSLVQRSPTSLMCVCVCVRDQV